MFCAKTQQKQTQTQIDNKMSVSQSSIYEQTPALKQIQLQMRQCLDNESAISDKIDNIIQKIQQLTISESYRLVIILSKQLKNNHSILRKYLSLLLSKQLLLSGYHRLYIFESIRILPWIASTINFQAKKSQPQRVKAYIQQLTLGGNGQQMVQQRNCFKLFKFVSQFLHWFSIKLPNHLNCPFPYRSTFKRNFQQLSYQQNIKDFQYFNQQDFIRFQKNIDLLQAESTLDMKDLSQFIVIQLNTLVEKQKQKSDLIFQIIKTGDSYCIKAIILQLRQMLQDSSKLQIVIKLMNHFMNVAQLQYIQMIKIYCLPLLLQYILPVNIITIGPLKCSKQVQKRIIDSVYLWNQMTKQLQLSNNLYKQVIKLFEQHKKPFKKVTIHDLSQFKTNLIDMKTLNKDKFKYIQKKQQENQIISALKISKKKKLDTSAINQLSEFKQSIAKNPFQQVIIQKPISISVSNSKQFFKQSNANKKFIKNQSKKQTKQYFYDQRVIPKKVNAQKSPSNDSFIAFQPSKTSKYSKMSSNNNDNVIFSQSSSTQSNKSIEPSVVYFNNSDSYNSVQQSSNGGQNIFGLSFNQKNQKLDKGSRIDRNQKQKQTKQFGQDGVFDNNDSKFILSTYQFDNTLQSSKSINSDSSKIINFGIKGNNLPQVQKKPQFAFKKAKVEQAFKMKANKDKYDQFLDNILSSHASVDKNSHKALNFDENQYSRIDKKNKDLRKTIQLPKTLHHFENVNDWQSQQIKDQGNGTSFSDKSGQDKFSQIYRRTQKNLKFKKERDSQIQKQQRKKKYIVQQYNNDKVYQLQRQIGKARQQKLRKKQQLKKKQKQLNLLKHKSSPSRDVNMLKKQNQILEYLVSQKNKQEKKQIKQIKPINCNNQIQDFFLQNKVKGVFSTHVTPYQKLFIKKILGSRCLLIKNDFFELGFNYSQRQNIISLYLTLMKAFNTVQIKVLQNSIIFDKQVQMVLKNQPARSQLKIKRKVAGLREKKKIPTFSQIINQNSTSMFVFPQFNITIYQQHDQTSQFQTVIPCSLYNLCTPLEIDKQIINKLKTKKVIKTDKLLLNPQFVKNTKQKINKYFPNYMNLVGGWKIIGFHYPQSIFENRQDEFYKFRINELKNIQFEFFGDPHTLLTETLLKIMANSKR